MSSIPSPVSRITGGSSILLGNSLEEKVHAYSLSIKKDLVSQIKKSVADTEALLDKWQNKIHADKTSNRVLHYSFPEIVSYLMIQIQEYLNTLQSVQIIVLPNIEVTLRNSNTIASKQERRARQAQEAANAKDENKVASHQMLGFRDEASFNQFKTFLTEYLAFNSDIMELLLSIASLTCFQVETVAQPTTSNLADRLNKNIPLVTELEEQEQDQASETAANEETARPDETEPLGRDLRSGAHKLLSLKKRLRKSTVSLVVRLHKATRVLLKMFPGAKPYQQKSIFDKNYLLQALQMGMNWNDFSLEQEVQRRAIYELEADKLISEGGINTKSVSYITETVNRIKVQMDERIKALVEHETTIEPIFFIQNRGLYKLWKTMFRGQYSTDQDMFKQAFSFKFSEDILTWKRIQSLQSLCGTAGSSPENLKLSDLVNLTDFIGISQACSLFEIDSLKHCDAAVRQTELQNLEESLRAKHLTKDINLIKTGNKTLFVRSKMNVQTNHRLLMFLYIFGVRTIHANSGEILQQLQIEVGANNVSSEDYGNSKLYGLYRTRDDKVIFKDNDYDKRTYQASTLAGLQKLLNMNEAAFDPQNSLLPSLGQNMGSYNILTSSIVRQSKIDNMRSALEDSVASIPEPVIQSQESVVELETSPLYVSLYEQDAAQASAINKARFSKYKLSHPGFFATFETQAEVYEMLVHPEIQEVLFWLIKDHSFSDDRDVKYNAKELPLKRPFLVSSYEVDSAADNKLFKKLFALGGHTGVEGSEEANDGLDLLSLKQVVRDSYHLCNFAAQESMWEAVQAERRSQLQHKYLAMFLKMCAISIDGYQRDRYMIKIKEMTDEVEDAQRQLHEEESLIQKGHVSQEELPAALERITGYLLKVETMLADKASLMDDLQKNQSIWQENDQIIQERKQSLRRVLELSMVFCNDLAKCEATRECEIQARLGEHESALFLIDEIFARNRVRSVLFMAQVQSLIEVKKESLNDLGQTQIELASKIQFIEEERNDMRKQRQEMQELQERKQQKDALSAENQEREQRIQQMKLTLGLRKDFGRPK